jgi:hypothetical protein
MQALHKIRNATKICLRIGSKLTFNNLYDSLVGDSDQVTLKRRSALQQHFSSKEQVRKGGLPPLSPA